MTQPSLDTTFDTSIIDLSLLQSQSPQKASAMPDQSSFSTTPSTPSEECEKEPMPPDKQKLPVRYVSTVDAYDEWAEVYDTDGNMLQAIDDHELRTLLPQFLNLVEETMLKGNGEGQVKITDFGCGTGRNTFKLAHHGWPEGSKVKITGIDASPSMLVIAKRKLGDSALPRNGHVEFLLHDFLDKEEPGGTPVLLSQPSGSERGNESEKGDILISTLVLEHFPLRPFFLAISSLLRRGGVALVTNMHAEMGSRSQAGFVGKDGDGNDVKVRGRSWVHGVQETVHEARGCGFEVLGSVREAGISVEMVESGIVGERGRKWIGVKVWYGFVLRKVG